MPHATHEARYDLLQHLRLNSLDDDGLSWTDKSGQGRLNYADIRRVRLISYPNYGGVQYRCYLHDRSGKKITIASHHYVSLGLFEDRSGSYNGLVRELLLALKTKGSDVEFVQGSTALWTAWSLLFGLGVAVMIGYVVGLLSGQRFSAGAIPPVVILLAFLPVSRFMMRQGRSKTFDPANPPAELLGG